MVPSLNFFFFSFAGQLCIIVSVFATDSSTGQEKSEKKKIKQKKIYSSVFFFDVYFLLEKRFLSKLSQFDSEEFVITLQTKKVIQITQNFDRN